MIDLKSPVWGMIAASCGGDGLFAAQLLRDLRDGDESAMDELHHQICHQFTVGETAYVATPHLVAIARSAGLQLRLSILVTIAHIVAGRQTYPDAAAELRDEWREEFLQSCNDARSLAAETLKAELSAPEDSFYLIGALAALHGHANLALPLLLTGEPRLSCPNCGEYIEY
jgi:hypothetical protein